jgi:hypothetical protein
MARGMLEIATAARAVRPVEAASVSRVESALAKAPLSPQPFLVAGVQAQTSGRSGQAADAFLQAQRRDPRSLAAAYFLADHYLQTGDVRSGLDQFSLLARLSPGGSRTAAPFIVTYAQNRSNWPAVSKVLQSEPGLQEEVLNLLAQNPSNADAVLALAPRQAGEASRPGVTSLLGSLVGAGEYARARQIWLSFAPKGANTSELIYDAGFATALPPPPFNWSFASSNVGLGERQPGGRLHVLFYGNQDGPLARELLTLAPGTYHLSMRLASAPLHGEVFRWSISCPKAAEPIATVSAEQAAAQGLTFTVPPNCGGQWLELSGRSADVSQQAELTITNLNLVRVTSGA